jgi:hypothetical protein
MVTRLSERTALVMWIAMVVLCLLALANVALEPTAGAWRGLGVGVLVMSAWFGIWRQRRRTLDGTLDKRSPR